MNLQSGPAPKKIERALIGTDINGIAIILATDGAGIACAIEQGSTACEDVGLADSSDCKEPGLYLFTGHSTLELESWDAPFPSEVVWHGGVRKVEPHEVAELYAMTPPGFCVVCGKPAVTSYPTGDECGEPSCGSAPCEIQIQAAKDYHDEAGDR